MNDTLLKWAMPFVILGAAWLGAGQAWASDRSNIFRHSRSASVLLVSVDKVTNSLDFGTGFFISDEGHILTNAHVLPDPSTVLVYIPEQGVFPEATRVIVDQDADLAVLHLPSVRSRALPLSPVTAEEGTEALAAGYPRVIDTLQMGLTLHATVKPVNISGWAMGRSRTQGRIIPFLQASGVIHSGTSGGPLVDASTGEVLGMVVHSVPYIGQATDRKGSTIGSVLLRADMSYAIPATRIRQWLADHQIPHHTGRFIAESSVASGPEPPLPEDPQRLGMSLFLTGHLVQTIAGTLRHDTEFMEIAVQHYLNARDIFPRKAVIGKNLAMAYTSLHRYDEALNLYESLLRDSPSDRALRTEMARTWNVLGHESRARSLYQAVLQEDSCFFDALTGLGSLYFANREFDRAVPIFEQAVHCSSSSAYAWFYLGESIVRAGVKADAAMIWKTSLDKIRIKTRQDQEMVDRMKQYTLSDSTIVSQASSPDAIAGPSLLTR